MRRRDFRKTPLGGYLATTAMAGLVGAGLLAACNTQPAQFLAAQGAIGKTKLAPVSSQTKMDILWVIDNSGSMCQEQRFLSSQFSIFIDRIEQTTLDFHIAVTTTHAPAPNVANIFRDPVAIEGRIQSTPQPVPGPDVSCRGDVGDTGDDFDGFGPVRAALETAKSCLAAPAGDNEYRWTDDQLDCVLSRRDNCGVPDTNSDGSVDAFDLFPPTEDYRAIPKVLTRSEYQAEDGSLDSARLQADFACMSLVGTRGHGIEKGLQVAVKAVDPELTGFANDLTDADTSAPNHGLIRRDAKFSLIFVTDENDCSHDNSDRIPEVGNDCPQDTFCTFFNSSQLDPADSPLLPLDQVRDDFLSNLAATKGLESVEQLNIEDDLLVASIHGLARRFEEAPPVCEDFSNDELLSKASTVCSSPEFGSAYSGDRYERFMRRFPNYIPNQLTEELEDPDDLSLVEPSSLCNGELGPAIQAIAEFIAGGSQACIVDNIYTCEQGEACPNHPFTSTPGSCRISDGQTRGFCDSGLMLTIERVPELQATVPEIESIKYCNPDSIGQLDTVNPSCVIDTQWYSLDFCAQNTNTGEFAGIQYIWTEGDNVATNLLAGYELKVTYQRSIEDEDDEAPAQ